MKRLHLYTLAVTFIFVLMTCLLSQAQEPLPQQPASPETALGTAFRRDALTSSFDPDR